MSINLKTFARILEQAEGVRSRPYLDTNKQITIGVGHNLSANGISPAIISALLKEDMLLAVAQCESFSFWGKLGDARQTALAELCFNLGFPKLRTFYTFLHLLADGEYNEAATDLRQTLWASQVGSARRDRIVAMIRDGEFPKSTE